MTAIGCYIREDAGLPGEFIQAVISRLEAENIEAHYEFPGTLDFKTADGRWWLTAHTGLHVHDDDGVGFPGDEKLVALEKIDGGWLDLDTYVAVLIRLITNYNGHHLVRTMTS